MRAPVALLLLACACGGNTPQRPAPKLNRWGKPLASRPVPSWVDRLPESSRTHVVSVGRSGPTFWPQDALANAREDARGKLALQLAAHVERLGGVGGSGGPRPASLRVGRPRDSSRARWRRAGPAPATPRAAPGPWRSSTPPPPKAITRPSTPPTAARPPTNRATAPPPSPPSPPPPPNRPSS